MGEESKCWDQASFDQRMQESQTELSELRTQLQNLLARFGLRALKTYQAARNLPLKPNEIESLVRYEIGNVAGDLSEESILAPIIKQVSLEWQKQQST